MKITTYEDYFLSETRTKPSPQILEAKLEIKIKSKSNKEMHQNLNRCANQELETGV